MEISESSISIFFMSKILALAPYSVRKNPKGVYTIKKSIPFLFYASSITLIMGNRKGIDLIVKHTGPTQSIGKRPAKGCLRQQTLMN